MASGGTKYGQGIAPGSLASCAIQLDVFASRSMYTVYVQLGFDVDGPMSSHDRVSGRG